MTELTTQLEAEFRVEAQSVIVPTQELDKSETKLGKALA